MYRWRFVLQHEQCYRRCISKTNKREISKFCNGKKHVPRPKPYMAACPARVHAARHDRSSTLVLHWEEQQVVSYLRVPICFMEEYHADQRSHKPSRADAHSRASPGADQQTQEEKVDTVMKQDQW
eukprot:jgi/Botrbrau1/23141/Bobra.0816s0001.1